MKRLFLIGIAALFLATEAAHAAQRPHVVISKPRVITKTTYIKISTLPPPKYDKPYEGELEIRFFVNSEDVRGACSTSHSDNACTTYSLDLTKCFIMMLTEDALKRKGIAYNFALRHELAHCNGWKHPNTTNGRKFSIGERWDEAEGAKWVAVDTKVAMPKLPASTRILPASPPVVCVTPDWKPEPCKNRSAPTVVAKP